MKPTYQMARPMTQYEREKKMADERHLTMAIVFVALATFVLGFAAGIIIATL